MVYFINKKKASSPSKKYVSSFDFLNLDLKLIFKKLVKFIKIYYIRPL
jgi:hypothetical protein